MTLNTVGNIENGSGRGRAEGGGNSASSEGSSLTAIFNDAVTSGTSGCGLSDMPQEVLTAIQKHIKEPGDKGAVARTSTMHWATSDPVGAAMGRFLDKIENGIPVTFQEFKDLKQLREFNGLEFSCTKPFTLNLPISQFTDDELQDIVAHFPMVEVPMNLAETIVVMTTRPRFPRSLRLQLDLSNSNSDDYLLKGIIAEFPNLTHLNLDKCKGITDAGLKELSKLKNLTHLNLGCCVITDEGLGYLPGMASLTQANA